MKRPKDEFERKRAARQKKIRKRRIFIGTLVLLILAAAAFAVLSVTVLFPIKSITAKATARYTAEEIAAASGLSSEDNIFTFSQETVKEQIRRRLPYAGDIAVSRRLPDTVEINIKNELEELACIPSDGIYYAVSEDWRVLNSYSERPEQLFTVNCRVAACKIGEQLEFSDKKAEKNIKALIEAIRENGIELNGISAEEDSSFTAAVSGRFIVKFGTAGEAAGKSAHLAGMLRSIGAEKTGKIDLSMWSVAEKQSTFIEGSVDLSAVIEPQSTEK